MKIQKMSNSSGFTLIELVVVIVILGILAATAAPKFIDLTSDANKSVLKALSGSMASASSLVHTKTIIQGKQNELSAEIDLDGDGTTDITTQYGYPNAHRTNGIFNALDIQSTTADWTWSGNGANNKFFITTASLGGRSGLYVNTTHILPTNCYVSYTGASAAGAQPVIEFVDTGC